MDSWWLLVDWLQGRSLPGQVREESKTTIAAEDKSSATSNEIPQLQQIQALKQQLEALEYELTNQGSPIPMDRIVSPMNQRFLDRRRAQQEQQQKPQVMDDVPRASESGLPTGDDKVRGTFSLSEIWASMVDASKSVLVHTKKMIVASNQGIEQDRNQQHTKEQVQRSESDDE